MNDTCAIVLAGGQGKRMRSDLPKPMFEVLGVPMLDWVTGACEEAGITDICVVTGFNHEVIERHIGDKFDHVLQSERRGTGHAVMMASDWLSERKHKDVLILNGDAPFIDKETILASLWQHRDQKDDVTVITAELENAHGYGRIIRSENGISAIVEEKDATDEQRRIREVNSGAYWFRAERLLDSLGKLRPNNAQGEYYLTDTVYILLSEGYKANAFTSSSPDTVLGANDRRGLLMLNDRARAMIINKLLDEGVEFASSDGVTIGRNVKTIGKNSPDT